MQQVSYIEAKVSNTSIITYPRYIRENYVRKIHINSIKNLVQGKPKGEVSEKNKKRITEMVLNLHTTINRNHFVKRINPNQKVKPLSFITLTLSDKQIHDDKYIKRNMLNEFLIVLQRNEGLKNYIWKAEPQQNGNIHFHIITDSYINKIKVANYWNVIQRKNGYLDNYYSKKGHWNAPSTKIEGTKSINDTAYYCAKYVGKNGQSRLINGRVWGCSDNMRELKVPKIQETEALHYALMNAVGKGDLKVIQKEYCNIYIGDIFNVMGSYSEMFCKWYVKELERNWIALNTVSENKFVIVESNTYIYRTKEFYQLKLNFN